MKINTSYLESLRPCQDRLNNWREHYLNFEGTLEEFLNLENISHKDKVWVFFRSIPKPIISKVAADMAESVLSIFELAYPEDLRPRKAIEAARAGINTNAAANAAADAAYSAYVDCVDYAACAAKAASDASYAAYINCADNAACAADYAVYVSANANEEIKQIEIMKKWLKTIDNENQ